MCGAWGCFSLNCQSAPLDSVYSVKVALRAFVMKVSLLARRTVSRSFIIIHAQSS